MLRLRHFLGLLLICAFTALQAQTISGSVTDSDGEPLIGASVLVKGTTTGTVTDIDGKFELNVPANSEMLAISYTGFKTTDIPLNGQSVYQITLEESSAQLEQVVVVFVPT